MNVCEHEFADKLGDNLAGGHLIEENASELAVAIEPVVRPILGILLAFIVEVVLLLGVASVTDVLTAEKLGWDVAGEGAGGEIVLFGDGTLSHPVRDRSVVSLAEERGRTKLPAR